MIFSLSRSITTVTFIFPTSTMFWSCHAHALSLSFLIFHYFPCISLSFPLLLSFPPSCHIFFPLPLFLPHKQQQTTVTVIISSYSSSNLKRILGLNLDKGLSFEEERRFRFGEKTELLDLGLAFEKRGRSINFDFSSIFCGWERIWLKEIEFERWVLKKDAREEWKKEEQDKEKRV